MTKPETKTVLGRVFHKRLTWWVCPLKRGLLILFDPINRPGGAEWLASLEDEDEEEVMRGWGETAEAAILALQSTLRKMAELEAQMAEQYPHLIIQQVERDEGVKLFPAMHKHLEPRGYAALCQVIGDIDYVWVYSVGATLLTHRTHDKSRVVDMYKRSTGADGELKRFREEVVSLRPAAKRLS